MKKLYTIFLIACFLTVSSTGFSQVHFPDTTHQQTWEVKTWSWFSCRTNFYKTGNTVNFCQNQYIEILRCDENEQNCMIFGYYRNSGATVLLRKNMNCNKQEILAYDFSATVGQVVPCQINVSNLSCTPTNFTVHSSQPVSYEGIFRNTQDMQFPLGNSVRYMNWIEGIGSEVHPFYPLGIQDVTNDNYTVLVKSYRNGQLIYFNNNSLLCDFVVSPKVFLEGSYNNSTGEMDLGLNNAGLIPLNQPFTSMGYNGQETTTTTVLTASSIVDWVLIQFRDADNPAIVMYNQAGLLDKMGNVHDAGGSYFHFWPLKCRYYIAVIHRNHLGVMTANPVTLTATLNPIDFTTIPLYGINAAKSDNGVQIMWAGDSNLDGTVNAADRSNVWNDRNLSTYLPTDYTLDGVVNSSDRSVCSNNRNRGAQLP